MRRSIPTDYDASLRLIRGPAQAFGWAALLGVLLALPYLVGTYWLSQFAFIYIYAVAGLGVMLLAGYTGLISIGHAAFLGTGAYTEAYLTARGVAFPLAMAAAALLSAAAGIVIGLPALRVRGMYLAIATLAFGFIAEEAFARWESVTGGNTGISVKPAIFLGWTLRSQASIYYLALGVCALVTLATINLVRSPTGRAFVAIRDSEVSAQSLGIPVARYKTTAFALSAAFVGLAGALYAHKLRFLSPEQFSISQSIDLIMLVVVGGLGTIAGAFFGAVFLIVTPQAIAIAKDYLPPAVGQAPGLQAVVFGGALIGFVLLEPSGLYGRWVKIATYLSLFPFYPAGAFRRQKSFQRSERFR